MALQHFRSNPSLQTLKVFALSYCTSLSSVGNESDHILIVLRVTSIGLVDFFMESVRCVSPLHDVAVQVEEEEMNETEDTVQGHEQMRISFRRLEEELGNV